jgi:hypothetical protein
VNAPLELLTPPEVAAFTRQSLNWVYAHWPELGGVKNGRSVRIPREGILAYWKRQADARERASAAEKTAVARRRRASAATDLRIIQLIDGGAR